MMGCLLILIGLTGCTGENRTGSPELNWHPVDSLNALLPEGVAVFEAIDPVWPLRAWYVKVDPSRKEIRLDILQSDEPDGRETLTSFAYDEGACVVLNGGYFRMDLDPSPPIGLLQIDSTMIHSPTPSVLRDEKSYPVARAAVGFGSDGRTEIVWAASTDSGLVSLDAPPGNREGIPVDSLSFEKAVAWPVLDALSAGPSLISAGQIRITVDEEVFFGSSIPEIHPRSAIGVTSNEEVILLVVDGRQAASRGVDLKELAVIMQNLGAVEAMNLDGGGSSALVVDGIRLNRPTGRDSEREVVSAVAAFCE